MGVFKLLEVSELWRRHGTGSPPVEPVYDHFADERVIAFLKQLNDQGFQDKPEFGYGTMLNYKEAKAKAASTGQPNQKKPELIGRLFGRLDLDGDKFEVNIIAVFAPEGCTSINEVRIGLIRRYDFSTEIAFMDYINGCPNAELFIKLVGNFGGRAFGDTSPATKLIERSP